MAETLTTLKTRRSCRSYKPELIEEEKLSAILEAGTYAATGMGKQSPIMIAVTDPETRNHLSVMNAAVWGKDGDPFYGAPVVIVVLADRAIRTYLYDGSLVMGNLMNAAHSLGVSSCWIHRAKEEFEMDEYKALLKELGIEGEWEGVGHCIIGYPEGGFPEAPERNPGRVYCIE